MHQINIIAKQHGQFHKIHELYEKYITLSIQPEIFMFMLAWLASRCGA